MHKLELSIAHLGDSRVVMQIGAVWVILNVVHRVRNDVDLGSPVSLHFLLRLYFNLDDRAIVVVSEMCGFCPRVKLFLLLIGHLDDVEEIFVGVEALLLAVVDLSGKLHLFIASNLRFIHATLEADHFRRVTRGRMRLVLRRADSRVVRAIANLLALKRLFWVLTFILLLLRPPLRP